MGKRTPLNTLGTAFLAIGAEGAGTHMLRDFLVAAGCNWRQTDESIKFYYDFNGVEYPFVFHRSLPHAGRLEDLTEIVYEFEKAGAWPWILFIVRDGYCTSQSLVSRASEKRLHDLINFDVVSFQKEAVAAIGKVANMSGDFDLITYEAFCLQEGYRRWLVDRWGLAYPEDFEIKFANEKYYE